MKYTSLTGNETGIGQATLDARDFSTFRTNIVGDSSAAGSDWSSSPSEHVYNVVTINGATDVVLDGVDVVGGNASNSASTRRGGGLYITNSSTVTLRNSFVRGNYAYYYGGGLFAHNGSTVTVENTEFTENDCYAAGAAISNYNATLNMTGVLLADNTSGLYAGALYNYRGTLTLRNATVANNSTASYRGTLYNAYSTNVELTNVILWGNTMGGRAPQLHVYHQNSGSATISNSLLQGSGGSASWRSAYGTDGGDNLDADPLLNADYQLQSSSPALSAGNSTYGNNIGYDQATTARFTSIDNSQLTINNYIVYPNPTVGEVNVKGEGTLWVQVMDAQGRQVAQATGQNTATLNLATQPAGLYLLLIKYATGKLHHHRIIKQ